MRKQRLLSLSAVVLLTTIAVATAIPPGIPVLQSPTGMQHDDVTRPTCQWLAATRAEWYRVRVWEILADSSRALTAQKWVPASTTSWTIDRTLMDGTYEWTVVAWNTDGFGKSPLKIAFHISTLRPNAVQLYGPSGDTESGGPITYQWRDDGKTDSYEVWIERNGVVWKHQSINAAAYLIGGRIYWRQENHPWGKYRWCVRGRNALGYGRWSELREVTVGQLDVEPFFKWDYVSSVAPQWYQIAIVSNGAIVRDKWVRASELTNTTDGYKTWIITPAVGAGSYTAWIRPWSPTRLLGPWSEPTSFFKFIIVN